MAVATMLITALIVMAVLMLILWLVHLPLKNAGIVDVGWTLGVGLCALIFAVMGDGNITRRIVIVVMTAVWGARLGSYLLFRVLGHAEDARYTQLRREWTGNTTLKFLGFFEFQALLAVIFALPALFSSLNSAPRFSWLEYLSVVLWIIAVAGEGVADWQLKRFKNDPANQGRLCRAGLWNYSRHPNYFFEFLVWVAFAVFALASPWGWIALICPALMLFFLFKVTGIPATEAQALRSKGDTYRQYQRTTSAFIPWFKRKVNPMNSVSPIEHFAAVDTEQLQTAPDAWFAGLLEKDLLPDVLVRIGIRRLLAQRLRDADTGDVERRQAKLMDWVETLKNSPIAVRTDAANAQHYEVPAAFFQKLLGPRLKYSACLWPEGVSTLEASEGAMLALVCQRARIANGQTVLDLGCGWGSFSLYAAERFPHSHFVGVSNSASQKAFIEVEKSRRGITNLEIITADMNDFDTPQRFDRIVSIEMFEHMRNYAELLRRIADWGKPDALLFVHIFTHKQFAYPFEVKDSSDWMAAHFFTGGQMPSDDLLLYFQDDFKVREHWRVNGTHYAKTCRAWLKRMDAQRKDILDLFSDIYGPGEALRWLVRWRVFLMASEKLFGYHRGQEWLVSHYLFEKAWV